MADRNVIRLHSDTHARLDPRRAVEAVIKLYRADGWNTPACEKSNGSRYLPLTELEEASVRSIERSGATLSAPAKRRTRSMRSLRSSMRAPNGCTSTEPGGPRGARRPRSCAVPIARA